MPSGGKDLLKTTSEPVIKLRVRTERPVMDAFMATQKSDTVCNFGTSLREVDRPSDVPGPGTYNMRAITGVKGFESKIRSTPHFSLRGREKLFVLLAQRRTCLSLPSVCQQAVPWP